MKFTIAYGCLFVMALLPNVCAFLAKRVGLGRSRETGGFDNHAPRQWLAAQEGFSARANAAQLNTFEALPFFFATVIIAHQMGIEQSHLDGLAALFVTLRVAYVFAYLKDAAVLRSLIWAMAFLCNAGLFFLVFW